MASDRFTDSQQTMIAALLEMSGLHLTSEERERVRLLHEGLKGQRDMLATNALGETEPATIFAPDIRDGMRHEHEQ